MVSLGMPGKRCTRCEGCGSDPDNWFPSGPCKRCNGTGMEPLPNTGQDIAERWFTLARLDVTKMTADELTELDTLAKELETLLQRDAPWMVWLLQSERRSVADIIDSVGGQ